MVSMGTPPVVQHDLGFDPPRDRITPKYFVVLKNLKGERDALRHAAPEVCDGLVPIFESPGRRGKLKGDIPSATLRRWIGDIGECVPARQPVFLDFPSISANRRVGGLMTSMPALEYLFATATKVRMSAVPVIRVGQAVEKAELLASISVASKQDACIRYPWRTFPAPGATRASVIQDLLRATNLLPNECHLVIDLEYLDPDTVISSVALARELDNLPHLDEWAGVSLIGTAIPKSLSCIREGTLGTIARSEWQLWHELLEAKPARVPCFGDYGVQGHRDPELESGRGIMRANIRYTGAEDTLVARGIGPAFQGGREQYQELCALLAGATEFSGAGFSWGDGVIDRCAHGATASASQVLWRGVGTSHHLAFVTRQLKEERGAA
jgi:hypothetical protein